MNELMDQAKQLDHPDPWTNEQLEQIKMFEGEECEDEYEEAEAEPESENLFDFNLPCLDIQSKFDEMIEECNSWFDF